MNKALIHIFDSSACLTKRQMKDYVNGIMTNEECHAAEVHLNTCMFCSEAIDGLYEQKEHGAVGAMVALDNEFLKDKFSLTHPEVHLNSLAPAQPSSYAAPRRRGRYKTRPLRHTSAIAATLLLGFGLWWYIGRNKDYGQVASVQQPVATATSDAKAEPALVAEPVAEPAKAAPLALATVPEKQSKAITANTNIPVTKTEGLQLTPAARPDAGKQEPVIAAAKAANASQPPVLADKGAFADGKESDSGTPARKVGLTSSSTEDHPVSIAKADAAGISMLDKGNDYYEQGKYAAALSAYRKEMSGADKKKRQEATLMAARCYLNIGNKARAEELLQQLISEGGRQKRAAKRLLREMKDN